MAPHLQDSQGKAADSVAPPSPPGFEHAFSDLQVPRTLNFNPNVSSGAAWVHRLPQLKPEQEKFGDMIYRQRLRNVAGVDRMVGDLIDLLEQKGKLDNTYIIYTTDNGFHIGNHRLHPGKRCGYEEDINIPLMIRGPNVPANVTADSVNSHTDMAPTILQMMGLSDQLNQHNFDGAPIPYTEKELGGIQKSEHVSVEFWDSTNHFSPEGKGDKDYQEDHKDGDLQPHGTDYGNTYRSLRMQTSGGSFYYSVWCGGKDDDKQKEFGHDHEFYDMKVMNSSTRLPLPHKTDSEPSQDRLPADAQSLP